MKSLSLSYFFAFLSLTTPFAGLHRFYLGQNGSGIAHFLTWGFFGIGTIIDLFNMKKLVSESNKLAINKPDDLLLTGERQILHLCKKLGPNLNVTKVAMNSRLSLSEAKSELDKLFRSGYCEKDVDEQGNEIYKFNGIIS
jgi:TM2 domain-containing membrane protein YozV